MVIRVALFPEEMEIYIKGFNDFLIKGIVDILDRHSHNYVKDELSIVVDKPSYDLLEDLCVFNDLLMI